MGDDNTTYFAYHPNHAAPILFAVLFGLTLIAHAVQAGRARALFMLTLVIATGMELVGYIMRYLAIVNDPQLWSFIISQVAIVVAPSFLCAQDYMIVGRMMAYVGPESTWISHTIITKLFVIVDIICVMTQSGGASIISGNNVSKNTVTTGRAILIAGLVLQISSFAIFIVLTVLFDLKARALKGDQLKQLRPLFTAFYVSAVLIMIRSVYRTIEFGTINFDGDAQGYLWNHEWPFFVIDAAPIFIAISIFNFIHPSAYLPRKKGLRMDGSVEQPRKHWWSRAEKTKTAESSSYTLSHV